MGSLVSANLAHGRGRAGLLLLHHRLVRRVGSRAVESTVETRMSRLKMLRLRLWDTVDAARDHGRPQGLRHGLSHVLRLPGGHKVHARCRSRHHYHSGGQPVATVGFDAEADEQGEVEDAARGKNS